jgi:hypothetical protein
MIVFICVSCAHRLQVAEGLAGMKTRCPLCQTVQAVPSEVATIPPSANPENLQAPPPTPPVSEQHTVAPAVAAEKAAMTDPSRQPTPPTVRSFTSVLSFTLIFAAIHAALWCIIVTYLILYVPAMERIFKDSNMTLPYMTIFVFQLSRLAANYGYIMSFLLLLEGGLLAVCQRRSRFLGWMWGLLQVLLPLLSGALVLYAIEWPKMKLLEALIQIVTRRGG